MAAEAQKVITRNDKPGAQEMSAAVHRLVDTIAGMLLQLPAPQRLEVLKQVEARIKPVARDGELVKKVSKLSQSSYAIYVTNSIPLGEYKVRIEGNKLIYEPVESRGDARVRKYGSRAPRLSIPKWAYEAIGSPAFVRVRVEGSRIIVEPI